MHGRYAAGLKLRFSKHLAIKDRSLQIMLVFYNTAQWIVRLRGRWRTESTLLTRVNCRNTWSLTLWTYITETANCFHAWLRVCFNIHHHLWCISNIKIILLITINDKNMIFPSKILAILEIFNFLRINLIFSNKSRFYPIFSTGEDFFNIIRIK